MLSVVEYNEQVNKIHRTLSRWNKIEYISLLKSESGHTIEIKALLQKDLILELCISYNPLYANPTMRFRLFKQEIGESDVMNVRLLILGDLELREILNVERFSVSLISDIGKRELWYTVNGCDSDDNVGPEISNYMNRWLSFYMLIFDSDFGSIFEL